MSDSPQDYAPVAKENAHTPRLFDDGPVTARGIFEKQRRRARRQAKKDPNKSKQKSAIANGALLPDVDGRSAWVRRCKEIIANYHSDVPDASEAERSLLRRAAVLTTELERMERVFALAGQAAAEDLDIYGRCAGNLRRLLEAVGLKRRPRDVTNGLSDLWRADLNQQSIDSIDLQPSDPQGAPPRG